MLNKNFIKIFVLVLFISLNIGKEVTLQLEAFVPSFDSVYVADFRPIKSMGNIYELVVIKDIKAIFIDVLVTALDNERVAYKLNNLEGCTFLSNPLFNRVFYAFYKSLVVNSSTPMSCPIKAGSYLLRNEFNKSSFPQIHRKGNFSLNLKIKSNVYDKVVLNLNWIYRFVRK